MRGSKKASRQGARALALDAMDCPDETGNLTKVQDREFAQQVLSAARAGMKGEAPPPSISNEATRLASILVFLGAQAEEFIRSSPDKDDKWVAAVNATMMINEILSEHRHPIHRLFSGLGKGLKGWTDTDARFIKSGLVATVEGIRTIHKRQYGSALSMSKAQRLVIERDFFKQYCNLKELENYCRRSDDVAQAIADNISEIIGNCQTVDEALEYSEACIKMYTSVPDPRICSKYSPWRTYVGITEDGKWVIPPPPELKARLKAIAAEKQQKPSALDYVNLLSKK